MKNLNEKQSILVMLAKGAEFIEDISVSSGMETSFENKNIFEDFPFILEHYTKNYFSVDMVPYKEIEALYVALIGDILFDINPELFKKYVFDNAGAVGSSRELYDTPLVITFIYALRYLEMKNVSLNSDIDKTLKGKFIKKSGSLNG